jgi:hypothetical protein
MTPLKAITRTLLLIAAGTLASCIDGREEFWLESDGSGRAEITYTLPAAVARIHGGESGIRNQIEAFLKNTPEINSSSCEVVTEGSRLRVKIRTVFDSALDLKNIASGAALKELPSAASHLAGDVRVDLQGRTLDFKRQASPAKALPGSAFLPASQLDGRRIVCIMHLPAAATDSNATRTEDSGRTLIWDIPLAEAIKEPLITRFKMKIPIPWALVGTIALPLSLAGGFVFVRIRKSRKQQA